jgi:hypothetical protein
MERALRRRNDVELFTAGPHTGAQIPWNGGMFLKSEYAFPVPDLVVPSNSRVTAAFVELHLPWQPDVWIQMNSTWGLTGKPKHGKNLIVGVDPHCINYDEARQYADKFFCMQTPYMKDGDIWLPFAYDPLCHAPLKSVEIKYDAGLIGAPYADRVRLQGELTRRGLRVLFTGYGPAYEEAQRLLSSCIVGLNWSTQKDLCARVFEVMAMGLCPVVNRVPDLAKVGFVEDLHYLGFDNVEEACIKVNAALTNRRALFMVEEATRAVAPHTWDARVEELLKYA